MQETPAGWYTDPESAAYLRYWDGDEWTDERTSIPPQPPLRSPWRDWVIIGMIVAGVAVVGAILFFAEGGATQDDGAKVAAKSACDRTSSEVRLVAAGATTHTGFLSAMRTAEADAVKARESDEVYKGLVNAVRSVRSGLESGDSITDAMPLAESVLRQCIDLAGARKLT